MTRIRSDKWMEIKFDEETHQMHLYTPTKDRILAHVQTVLSEDIEMKVGEALMDLGWTPPPGSRWEKL